MEDRTRHNPKGRFTGLSQKYARHRPSYPAEAIDFILSHCRLSPGSVLVDVGCGTGISARLFAGRGLRVIGIEPNDDMKEQAIAGNRTEAVQVDYRSGSAEQTGLNDGLADAVLAAQAFHWFEPKSALTEFHRILKPNGFTILMWNERDEDDSFTKSYGMIMRAGRGADKLEMSRGIAGEALLHDSLFLHAQVQMFRNQQTMDLDGLLGRAFSTSYAPRDAEGQAKMTEHLTSLFKEYAQDHRVTLRYKTSVYSGERL